MIASGSTTSPSAALSHQTANLYSDLIVHHMGKALGDGTRHPKHALRIQAFGTVDEANAAFDKAIAADPTKADAYYQKGVNLINKATTDSKTGKVIPAPGTEEALNKYLELQPTGQFAEGAKSMLQYIGSSIETSYGKKKAAATKK